MIKHQLLSLCFFSIFYFMFSSVNAQCEGGAVETSDGLTEVYACIADNDADYIGFSNNSLSEANYLYLLTDEANQVLALPEDNFVDFNGVSLGTCRVWGLSYTGNLTVGPGDFLEEAMMLSDDCFSLSDNFVTVYRVLREPSQIMAITGETTVEINSNANATVQYTNTPILAGAYSYVILREDGKIIGIDESGSFDFSTFDAGKYFIWGYAYYGDFLLEVGDFLDGQVATACVTKSDNFILIRKEVDSSIVGCNVEGARVKTTDGETTAYACVGDDDGDYVGFVNTSIVNASYRYLITDENNEILAIVEDNFANFDEVAPGICRVWGLSYEGDFIGQIGDNAAIANLATSCFDLSDNFVTIDRSMMEETTVTTVDNESSILIEDNLLAAFNFINSGTGLTGYRYFITDKNQKIIGISEDGYFDFAPFEEGKYFVWGYTFSGEIILEVGDRLDGRISTGCFEKSTNFVFVRKNVEALLPEPCLADAGTLTIDANPVELLGGVAMVSATPNGDRVVPTDFEVIYVLTSGNDIVIQMFASFPVFNVTEPGLYTLHTLIAELNDINADQYFEASGIIVGQTTGAEVLDMIEAQEVCADFDLLGAAVEVLAEQGCVADAGFLFPVDSEVPVQLFTILSANHVIQPTVPLNYEVTYLLATTDNGILVQSGDNPTFVVNEVNTYTILTLITQSSDPLSPDYFDLGTIALGATSIQELADQLAQLGICFAFDAVGATIVVVEESTANNRSEEEERNEAKSIENTTIELALYPNPSREHLNIRFPERDLDRPSQLIISDANGRQVHSRSLSSTIGNEVLTIRVGQLATGWYVLTWYFDNQLKTERFYKY